MSRRALVAVAQALGTVVLLAAAVGLAGGDALLARLGVLDARWLVLALALTVPMQVLSAWRWQVVAGALGAPIALRRALGEYYLAALLNAVLPGGIVGDASRVWRHGRGVGPDDGSRFARPLGAVLIERGAGQGALALVLGVGLAHALATRAGGAALAWPAALLVGAGAVALVAGAGLALAGLGAASGSARAGLERFRVDLGRLLAAPRTCAAVGALSALVVATYIAIFLVAARAVGPLGPAEAIVPIALVAIPLVLITMLLPISVGGLGPREAAAAALWPLLGHDAAAGAAAALLYGAVIVAGSLPGALVLAGGVRGS